MKIKVGLEIVIIATDYEEMSDDEKADFMDMITNKMIDGIDSAVISKEDEKFINIEDSTPVHREDNVWVFWKDEREADFEDGVLAKS